MPSHFSTIGFHLTDQAQLLEAVQHIVRNGETVRVDHGSYYVWTGDDGGSLWVQSDSEGRIIGVNPHFSGPSRMRVGLEEPIIRVSELDGAFRGWSNPETDDIETGYYPFVFDTPDFDMHNRVVIPSIVQVQIAAFAHELSLYSDEAQFRASQQQPGYAAESFIPSGLFTAAMEKKEPPAATAIFAGSIVDYAARNNSWTGLEYLWLRVKTLGGEADVVADPEIVKGEPVKGGLVLGSYWLSGRIQPW